MLASDTPWAAVPLCPPKRFRDADSSTFSRTFPLTGRTRSGEVTLNHTGTSERKRGAVHRAEAQQALLGPLPLKLCISSLLGIPASVSGDTLHPWPGSLSVPRLLWQNTVDSSA